MGTIRVAFLHLLMIILFVGGIVFSFGGVFSCVLTTDASQGIVGLIIGMILMSLAYAIRHHLAHRRS